jgi:hypothetical protein
VQPFYQHDHALAGAVQFGLFGFPHSLHGGDGVVPYSQSTDATRVSNCLFKQSAGCLDLRRQSRAFLLGILLNGAIFGDNPVELGVDFF